MGIEPKTHGELAQKAVDAALGHLGVNNVDLDVIEVCSKDIRRINAEQRGVDKVTDVLSFPLLELKAGMVPKAENFPRDVNPETGKVQLGDILICPQVAAKQAKEYGHKFEREFAFLVVHGVLHLLGYDHMTAKDEQRMMFVAEEILAKMELGR